MRGPIDYIIVGFEGNKFNGSILSALIDALEKGVIGLVALSAISKDKDGNTTTLDMTQLDDQLVGFAEKYKPLKDTVDQDDIDEVAELLDNNTTAGLLVVEQLWAIPLKKAIIEAEGFLVAEGRIHPEAVLELDK